MKKGLQDDPRWQELMERGLTCASCGKHHRGLPDLACSWPDAYPGIERKAPNSALDLKGDFLSEDFCILDGKHFFVRAVLELPIFGNDGECFGFGVWSTLSEMNFVRYVGTFDSSEQGALGPWFGWFSNQLKGYPDTFNLKCQVHLIGGPNRQRPRIKLEPTDHPLAIEQREGITLERLLDIHAINCHDLTPSLGD